MEKDWLKYEKEAFSLGYTNICGVDEAGRGPLEIGRASCRERV